jgi:transcription antitermination factor NusG
MNSDFQKLHGRWLCVQVRSGSEFKSAFALKERGYESFVPAFEQKRTWSDRTKIVQVALFTGYVFLRFNAASAHPAVTAPGVLRFVGTGKIPMPIEDSEIEALQLTTNAGLTCGPCAFFEIGEEVAVRLGPFASLKGKIVRFQNTQRLVLSVNRIEKSIFVEVDGYEVVSIAKPFSTANPLTLPALERGYSSALPS